jgi:hypothetical protein
MPLFDKSADYQAFERVLRETRDESPMRTCAIAVVEFVATMSRHGRRAVLAGGVAL